MTPAVRAAISAIDPDQPLVNVRTMDQAIGNTVAQLRLQTTLLIVFALLAAALAVIGVYGVMAYTVSHRTQEIGVRIALGASSHDVASMVVRQGIMLAGAGIVIGLAGAVLVARAMQSLLFNPYPFDATTFVGA